MSATLERTGRQADAPRVPSLAAWARAARLGLRVPRVQFDPWVPAVGVVALLVFVLHGFTDTLDRDLGLFLYDAQQVLAGAPPYVAQMNTVGPLADLVPALFIALGRTAGLGDLYAARLGFTLISTAVCVLLYLIGRDVFRSRGAGLVSVTTFLTFEEFAHLAANGPREKTTMVLFLVAALYALSHRRWATAGVLVGLGALTWQPVLLVGVAATAVVLVTDRGRWWRSAVRFVVGGLAPSALCAGYFLAVGAFGAFLNGFVLINARYMSQVSVLTHPTYIWEVLVRNYGWSLLPAFVGTAISLALAALPVRSRITRRPMRAAGDGAMVVALGLVSLVGLVWSMVAFNGGPDLFELLPTAALGVGGLVPHLRTALTPRRTTAVVAVWTIACLAWATTYAVHSRGEVLPRQRASLAGVLGNAPVGSTVLSIEAPGALALTHRTNPTTEQLFMPGMASYLDHTYPGGLVGYGQWISRHRPAVLVVRSGTDFPWLTPTLFDYRRIPGPKWDYYVERSVPHADVARMRAANRRALGLS